MSDPETNREERQLYEMLVQQARRLARPHLIPSEAAELAHDLAVELILLRARDPEAFAERSTPGHMYRAIVNRILNARRDKLRRRRREVMACAEEAGEPRAWSDPEWAMTSRELEQLLAWAVSRMPRRMRQVFLLIRDNGCTYREVAARMGTSPGTVHTQLSRALAILRDALRRYHGAAALNGDGQESDLDDRGTQ
jgi:RNA polymerase sigma-70 factor (ECF subfamily)